MPDISWMRFVLLIRSRFLPAVLLCLSLSAAAALGTTEESDYETVSGAENWTHEFTTDGIEPGRYNFLLRATDRAGNVSLSNPVNIVYDPDADIPHVAISNPEPDQQVSRRLVVLGTAVDDAEISTVRVWINDGPATVAEGTRFWSAEFDLLGLDDGRHTVHAQAEDNNGTPSQVASVRFVLDTGGPDITVTDPPNGSIVGGRFRVNGELADNNVLDSIAVRAYRSEGDDDIFQDTRRYRWWRRTEGDFSFRIDTRDLDDGPLLVWLTAKNRNGTTSEYPLLYFVDNQEPDIRVDQIDDDGEFAAPPVPGNVVLSGMAADTSGIERFSWEVRGGESGLISLTPGDPFWVLPLDLTEQRRSARVTLSATDGAGNTTEKVINIPVDQEADKPTIDIGSTTDPRYVAGLAADDDGVSRVEYRLGRNGDWRRTSTTGPFTVHLPDAPAGEFSLFLRAVDINDTVGDTIELTRRIERSRPVFSLPNVEITTPDEPDRRELFPGLTLNVGDRVAVRGTVELGADPRDVRRIRYRLGDNDWSWARVRAGDDPTAPAFDFNLDRREPAGRYDLELEIIDEAADGVVLDRIRTWYYRLDVVPEEPDPERTYVTSVPDAAELALVDARLDPDLAVNGLLRFRNSRPLVAVVPGEMITDAVLEPDDSGFIVSARSGVAVIEPRGEALQEDVVLVVSTAAGTEYRSTGLGLIRDDTPPRISIDSPDDRRYYRDVPEVMVRAEDGVALRSVEIAVNGGLFQAMQPPPTASDEEGDEGDEGDEGQEGEAPPQSAETPADVWTYQLPANLPEGKTWMEVRGTDHAGNRSHLVHTIVIDRTPPTIRSLVPGPRDTVNGEIQAVFVIDSATPLDTIFWYTDGETERSVNVSSLVSVPLDLRGWHPERPPPRLEVRDIVGNTAVFEMDLTVDIEADRPRVAIQLPPQNSVQRENFTVSGTALDDDGDPEVIYRINDGPEISAGIGTSFTIPISIAELGDNEHTITVYARDIGGTESEPVSVDVRVSLNSPVGAIIEPALDDRIRGQVMVLGTAADENGIGLVQVSIDNGVSFHDARPDPDEGWERWSYPLDTAVLRDGLHALQYRIEDAYGTVSLSSHLITVDNTPPTIAVDEPREYDILGGDLRISGRVTDADEDVTVQYRLIPVGEGAGDGPHDSGWRNTSLLPGGVLREVFYIENARPGDWNIAVRAIDRAGNLSTISRNLRVVRSEQESPRMALFSPVDGDRQTGSFVVSGVLPDTGGYREVRISLNDTEVTTLSADSRGSFFHDFTEAQLASGTHRLTVTAPSAIGGATLVRERTVHLEEDGPVLRIESHRPGALVGPRPILTGSAGYFFEEPPGLEVGTGEYRRAVADYRIQRVEVSLDNGRTFSAARGSEQWQFRIETEDLDDGPLPLVVRATSAGGDQRTVRSNLILDTRSPEIAIDQPRENVRFHDSLFISGTAGAQSGLDRVEIVLRQGDKNRYQVPQFIQGLYVDVHALGASLWDIGIGLTFFDDNVKIQGQVGVAPEGRFSGTVVGGKLLANVASLPLSYFMGPNFSNIYGALALGANFSYFTMDDNPAIDQGLVLGGIVGQLEFPIVRRPSARIFNSFSLYTEMQLWFISSDVQGGTETRLSFGLRSQVL